jgi:hypothetical protein
MTDELQELPSDAEEFCAELPVRAHRALRDNNVQTWEEAAAISEKVWLNTPNFGRKALNDLKAALAKRGLYTPEDLSKDIAYAAGLRDNRKLYHSTLINFAFAFAGLRESEIMMSGTLHGEETRFYPPRLYISRKAAELLRTHPELRALDIQDADAIAFDPNKRTDPERRAEIVEQLSASGAGARVAVIIEKFAAQAGTSNEELRKN